MDYSRFRELFPITRRQTFFNHAAVAPLSLPVVETLTAFYRECSEQASAAYPDWQRRLAAGRQAVATLLGARPDEIAFTGNTSTGLALVAEAFPWRPGDAVLVPVPDYPANVYPWQHLARRGVEVLFVERQAGRLTPEMLTAALRPNVRLLALSTVDYATGFAADLPAIGTICRERGIFFAVDAIQSLGLLPLDVRAAGIHALAAGGHKWLCGPTGSGILFLSGDAPITLTPPLVGWKSVTGPEDFRLHFTLRADAGRFEPGTLDYGGIFGLGRAVELLLEAGIAGIRSRVLELVDLLTEGLGYRGLELATPLAVPGERSGILCFRPRGDGDRLLQSLVGQGVAVALRNGKIRLAPHFYNNEEDVARFFAALDRLG